MARQLMHKNETKEILDKNKSALSDENELGKPLTRIEGLLFMEEVLCDLQSIYILVEMLVEKNIIDFNEFLKRVEDAKNNVKETNT